MHQRLEQYLNELAVRLNSLPAYQRDEELAEVRAHLEAMIAANQELGDTEEEAVHAALRQFDASRKLGQGLARTWRRGQRRTWRETLSGAAICAAGCYWGISSVITLVFYPMVATTPSEAARSKVLNLAFYVLLPILPGLVTGLATPKRAVIGTALALSVFSAYFWFRGQRAIAEAIASRNYAEWEVSPFLVYPLLVTLGAAAAWAGTRWTQRRRRAALR